MRERDPPDAVGESLQVVFPVPPRLQVHLGVAVELVDHRLDHAVEQVLPAGHVGIQRHRLYPQDGSEPAHRQVGQAVRVDEGDGGLDHQ